MQIRPALWDRLTGQLLLELSNVRDHNDQRDALAASVEQTQPLPASKVPQNARKEVLQVAGENDVKCEICAENIGDFALVPCGHADICVFCARKFEKSDCPFCKAKVEGAVKIFRTK